MSPLPARQESPYPARPAEPTGSESAPAIQLEARIRLSPFGHSPAEGPDESLLSDSAYATNGADGSAAFRAVSPGTARRVQRNLRHRRRYQCTRTPRLGPHGSPDFGTA